MTSSMATSGLLGSLRVLGGAGPSRNNIRVLIQLCLVSREHLNYAINKLYQWSNVWQLQIAVDKCFVCSIHPSNQKPNLDLYNYTVSQKNVLTLKRYSSKLQGAILMKFGKNIQNTLE